MQSLTNLLNWINNNWGTLLICVGLSVLLGREIRSLFTMKKEEKIEFAKNAITSTLLKSVASAEKDYEAWRGSGQIKRAQVIDAIFKEYPILTRVADEEEFTDWLDQEIDNALSELKKILEQN